MFLMLMEIEIKYRGIGLTAVFTEKDFRCLRVVVSYMLMEMEF
jgi:hypothetical protein